MFSTVRIGRGEIDIGVLADALVYYGRVNLYVNANMMGDLAQKFGYDALMQVIDTEFLHLTAERYHYAVHTRKEGKLEIHDLGNISMAGTASGKKITSAADEIEHSFVQRSKRTSIGG